MNLKTTRPPEKITTPQNKPPHHAQPHSSKTIAEHSYTVPNQTQKQRENTFKPQKQPEKHTTTPQPTQGEKEANQTMRQLARA
jgi:hypothetical protein